MSNGIEPFYMSGWDPNPMASSNQDGGFPVNSSMVPQSAAAIPHFPALLENQNMGMGVLKTSDVMMMIDEEHRSGFHQKTKGASSSCPNSDNGGLFGVSPANAKGKRKVEQQPRISSMETLDDNKNECDPNFNSNSRGKQQFQAVKQAKDTVIGAENPQENYAHVRAKRGQATNSHSLAERVRREKISERMKLLQDLVPGCHKITGKAVMLDEIINYVQSLQQQVEFLSMKIATVNPEINVDLDRILPNEILHPQANEASITGPVLSYPQLFHGHHPQVPMSGFIGTNPTTFHHLPLSSWNSELQSILQPGFGSNQSVNSSEPSGPS